jgi:hypothetical protein
MRLSVRGRKELRARVSSSTDCPLAASGESQVRPPLAFFVSASARAQHRLQQPASLSPPFALRPSARRRRRRRLSVAQRS